MSSLPGQLSATAPLFVPTPKTQSTRSAQRRAAKRNKKAQDAHAPSSIVDTTSTKVQSQTMGAHRPSDVGKAAAPQAPATHGKAGLLHAGPSAASVVPVVVPPYAAAPCDLVAAHRVRLSRTLGEADTARLMIMAKWLLPQSPNPKEVVAALEVMQQVATEHQQSFGVLCYKLASDEDGRGSRLAIAERLVQYAFAPVAQADAVLRQLYARSTSAHPTALQHVQLMTDLLAHDSVMGILRARLADTQAPIEPVICTNLVARWLSADPQAWPEAFAEHLAHLEERFVAHALLLRSCAASCVCLPPALEARIAACVAHHGGDASFAEQVLHTTAALLAKTPTEVDALAVWDLALQVTPEDQAHLKTLQTYLYTASTPIQAQRGTLQQLVSTPLAPLVGKVQSLDALVDKTHLELTPSEKVVLLRGLVQSGPDAQALEAVFTDPQVCPIAARTVLLALVKLPPNTWLTEAKHQLSLQDEFVIVTESEAQTAALHSRYMPENRRFGLFSPFG